VIAVFAAGIGYGLFLLLVFDPELQSADAGELFARSDDGRAFLLADLVFPFMYTGLALAGWRFGRLLVDGRPPLAFVVAAYFLSITAILDITEGILLLVAIDSESADLVNFVHAMAIPKVAFFVVGIACSLVVLARAVTVVRDGVG
jgi:hypothetical protein